MKKWKCSLAVLLALLFLNGCGNKSTAQMDSTQNTAAGSDQAPSVTATVAAEGDMFTDRDFKTDYTEEKYATVTFGENGITSDSNAVQISGTVARLTEAGTYVLSGTLEDGQIIVNAEKTDKVQIVLDGANITSATSAAIYVLQADKVFVTSAAGTENSLKNGGSFVAVDENNIDAAVYSKEDLTLNGEGSLLISSPAGHGVVSKDDLAVTGGIYTVESASQGLNGKQSVRISGGTFTITAGKDGIHAEDKDDETQGFGYISGGNFTITAEGDGVSAAGSLQIAGGTFVITAGGGSVNGSKASSDHYGGFMGGMGGPGGKAPRSSSQSTTTAEDESTSMKGIKSGGDLTIQEGTFQIDAADDGVHTNANLAVTGGSFQIATGDDGFHADERLDIAAGTVNITESYEGLEGHHIAVSGGEITLVASDDGLNAAGGTDMSGMGGRDQMFGGGMGGMGGMSSGDGSIVISGGILDVQASGDGIDANGTLEISGGYTLVCGPTQGDTATLDYDKTAIITGGTFIGTGASGMAQTFSGSENQGVIAVQLRSGSGNAQITVKDEKGNVLLSHTPALSYNVVILSSPEIIKGESYTIFIGEQSLTVEAS